MEAFHWVCEAYSTQENDPQVTSWFALNSICRCTRQIISDCSPQLCGKATSAHLPPPGSKHTFVKWFQDVSKVQFCLIVTVDPNHFMLISYNLLHCQFSSSLIFISQLNVHLFIDISIKLDCNKFDCASIYFPFLLENSKLVNVSINCMTNCWEQVIKGRDCVIKPGEAEAQSPFMVDMSAHVEVWDWKSSAIWFWCLQSLDRHLWERDKENTFFCPINYWEFGKRDGMPRGTLVGEWGAWE